MDASQGRALTGRRVDLARLRLLHGTVSTRLRPWIPLEADKASRLMKEASIEMKTKGEKRLSPQAISKAGKVRCCLYCCLLAEVVLTGSIQKVGARFNV